MADQNRNTIKAEPLCCIVFDTDLYQQDLFFPEKMSPSWSEFIRAHGIYEEKLSDLIKNAVNLGNGKIAIHHRCSKLDKNGKCTIYDKRPKVCREYVCGKPQCKFKNICSKSNIRHCR